MLLIADIKLCRRHLGKRYTLIGPVNVALDGKEGVGDILVVPCVGAVDGFLVIEGHYVDIVQHRLIIILRTNSELERKAQSCIFWKKEFLPVPSLRSSLRFLFTKNMRDL